MRILMNKYLPVHMRLSTNKGGQDGTKRGE